MKKTLVNPRVLMSTIFTLAIGAVFAFSVIFVHAQNEPTIVSAIMNASNATTSTAQIGTIIHESAIVASSTGPTPTGTVDFNIYPNTSCSGTAGVQLGVTLTNGMADSATTT